MSFMPPSNNDFVLVENIDIFVVALIGFTALLRLPRGLARLWKRSEWTEGHFIRSGAGNGQIPLSASARAASPIKESPPTEPMSATTSEQHFDHSSGFVVTSKEAPRPTYPPHIPAYPAFLRPVAEHLRLSIVPWYSNSQVLVMLAYLGTLLYAYAYHTNFLNNPRRLGIIAVSQLPFLYAFAAKNSIPGSLLGVGYQCLNYFHRYVGFLVILAANIHAIGYFYKWTLRNVFSLAFQDPSNRWGLAALACMDVIFVFSLPIFRERAYNIFRITHLVGFWVIVPALYLHHSSTRPFIITVSVVYLLDQVFCLLKTRLVIAGIRPLPTLSATRIDIPSLRHGWRAGQHVRIRVLSTSLGWFGWMEAHPFTIASAPATTEGGLTGEEGLLLICKKTGGWTSKLYDMAKFPQPTESGTRYASRTVIIQIEGPYGGPGHAMFASYSAVAMIIGGSGITFALSIIQDLVQKGLRGESCVKVIELKWIVPNPDAMTPLIPFLTSLMDSCSYLTISVHYTRPYTPPMEGKCSNSNFNFTGIQESVPTRRQIVKYAGRPARRDLVSMMENTITRATSGLNENRTSSHNVPSGMLVGVCGPQGMSKDVLAAVSAIDSKIKTRIGGIEMHQETFEF